MEPRFPVISTPSNNIEPSSGVMIPPIKLKSVLFPLPDGPNIEINSPSSAVNVIPSRIFWFPKDLLK